MEAKALDIKTFVEGTEIKLVKAQSSDAELYFNTWYEVGKKWNWVGRIIRGENGLLNDLSASDKHLFFIKTSHNIIGICEFSTSGDVSEIVYFGLKEDFIGKAYGKKAFSHLLRKMKSVSPAKIILQTCSLDAPQARSFYRVFGFETVRIERDLVQLFAEKQIYAEKQKSPDSHQDSY